MCGIGGILRVWTPEQRELALRTPHAQSIPEAWLDILDDAVKHRGPDGQGRFRDRAMRADGCVVDVAFVHRRLSIIDHVGGHQPMVLQVPKGALSASSGNGGDGGGTRPIPGRLLSVEDLEAHNRFVLAEAHAASGADPELALRALSSHDRIAVVFNGCIYNHRELRADLQRTGHVFSTDHSDTEVLVHGWREWQGDLFDHLDGMWSWIIWDSANARLVFSRDPAGEKPLFVSPSPERDGGVIALCSTAAGLWRVQKPIRGAFDFRVAASSLVMWGFEEPAAGDAVTPVAACSVCVFDESSGCFLQDNLGDSSSWRWKLGTRSVGRPLTPESIDSLLGEAVSLRTRADVPIACFLSGGIDSALVAAHVKQLLGTARTFTVRMPDDRFDESEAAAMTARALGTDHSTIECRPTPASDLIGLITQLGQPLGDSSLLPTHWVSRAVADAGFRVALGGDGGDELFGGYDRYRVAGWLARYSSVIRRLPGGPAGSTHPKSARSRMARLVRAAQSGGYPDLLRIMSIEDTLRLFRFDGPGTEASSRNQFEIFDWTPQSDPRMYDFLHYLPYDLCAKVDTAAMSLALETRAPLLSQSLVACALSNPISTVMPRGQRKGLLRQVARKYLPADIVDRPEMGFAIPIGEWYRSDYGGLRTMLLDHLNSTEPFGPPSLGIDLNMKFIRQMLDEHLGTGPSGRVIRDHSQRLYMLLVLSIWAKWLGSLR